MRTNILIFLLVFHTVLSVVSEESPKSTKFRGQNFSVNGISLWTNLAMIATDKGLVIKSRSSEGQCEWVSHRGDLVVATSYDQVTEIHGTILMFGNQVIGKLGDSPDTVRQKLQNLTDTCNINPIAITGRSWRSGQEEPWCWGFLVRAEFENGKAKQYILRLGE